MRRIATGIMVLTALLCLPFGAQAAPTLYAAATPVPDQSAAARETAFARDLAQVLVKVSGDPEAARFASVMDAPRLMLEYRYRQRPAAHGGGLELWARFDPEQVKAALAAAGEPLWGENRPSVMVWVTAPAGIVGEQGTEPLAQAMREAADQRGLPLVLPLLDLADRKQVSQFDIQSFFLPTLTKATARYGAQAMLIGSITDTGVVVTSRWELALGGRTNPFTIPAPNAQSAAAAAVGEAATLLAQQFARLPSVGAASAFELAVSGVNSLQAEATVRRAVASVQGVQGLRLASVAGDSLRFELSFSGSAAEFARLLALSRILVPSDAAVPAPAGSTARPTLSFRYRP